MVICGSGFVMVYVGYSVLRFCLALMMAVCGGYWCLCVVEIFGG
jgi:hypothetical protein